MSIINSQPLIGASGQGGYFLTKSLRFRSSASAYLQRSFSGSQTNANLATLSVWLKRGALGVYSQVAGGVNDAQTVGRYFCGFRTGDTVQFGLGNDSNYLETTQVFRDTSAWYHIMAVYDSTQATASNRVKIYVNGVQVTAFSTANYPAQNTAFALFRSTNSNNRIADQGNGGQNFDGYLAEFNFIDGQALTPSSFGETSSTTGVWIPKRYTGTYGNWGFYLPFTDVATTSGSNAGLGKDFSGNGNYWTTNNISVTSGSTYDSMKDVPTLTDTDTANYCTLNPISNPNGTIVTYSDGNLAFSHSASSGNAPKMTVQGTMALPANKTYWEYTVGATVNDQVGIGTMLVLGGSADGTAGARYINTGAFQSTYTVPSSGASYTTGDIIGMAYDQPNGTLAFYKNNSLQGTITNISTSEIFFPHRSVNSSGTGGAGVFNFGQRPFTYTPPTGFKALNTFNLPTPTIGATASSQANRYMDVKLFTGNNSSQTISGFNFAPDFVWTKSRANAYGHDLYNIIMGVNKRLQTNNTNAENTLTDTLTAFNSDGFTLGANDNANYSGSAVTWCWRANGSGSTNTAGSITSTVSANTTAGFSIVTYTGTGSAATVGHGLGVTPSMIIVKQRNTARNWAVWQTTLTGGQALFLDSTLGTQSDTAVWNNTTPTSSVFSVATSTYTNQSSGTYVAYCFSAVAGYSAFGSYTGNGSSDGAFVYTGFRPKFVLIKLASNQINAASWCIWDTSRSPYNLTATYLNPNTSDAESTDTTYTALDILSNGFKIRSANTYGINQNGAGYIYAAFAESPFKFSNAR